jgi:hypothetical protein
VIIGRWRGPSWRVVDADPRYGGQIRDWISSAITRHDCPVDAADAALAVAELYANAVMHGPAGGRVLAGYCLWRDGSPYLTGVPPIRPLRSACPEPAGRPYGALVVTPLLATDRDRRRRGSFLACRAVRPENRGHVCRCRHSRGRLPHLSPSLA